MHAEPKMVPSRGFARKSCLLGGVSLLLCISGCGSGNKSSDIAPTAPAQGPQTYFAPYMAGTTNGGVILGGPKIYAIDDSADAFSQSTFQLNPPQQQGPQVINVGVTTPAKRGLLSLGITTNYVSDSSSRTFIPTSYNPPKSGSFALELAGQAGGLVQLVGQPAALLVAAVQCPSSKTAQTYQFVTIPAALVNPSVVPIPASTWDPTTDTAYGSVDISSDGVNINFNNIHQYTLSSQAPTQQPSSPVTGICAPTVFGSTITLGQLTVKNPIPGGGLSTPPQASVGIGPTGLLVEHNGAGDASSVIFPGTSPGLFYDNTLGAGTGAVGLPKPSGPLDTGALLGTQYLGFIYGAGIFGNASSPTGWSSHLASFGFSSVPSSCAAVAANTGTMIYGGDFPKDDPTASSDGFGNCDLAIDLGMQDTSNNGRFPKATVWMFAGYAANTTGKNYSFPAVAIAGQLKGKNAIFLIGVDSTQPWAIYLLQSN